MEKARLLCLDTEARELREVHCGELQDFYDELRCDTFDIARRVIGGKAYDIYCDDEGLLIADPIVSAADQLGNPMLCGNLIFSNTDGAGNTVSLSDADIAHIRGNVRTAFLGNREVLVVVCEYG